MALPRGTNFRAARRILVSSYAMTSPLPDAVPLNEVKRALITKHRHYGDVLLASPVFSTLQRAAPHVEIDALVYSDTAPMLANHPAITRLFTIDREWKRQDAVRHCARAATSSSFT